MYLPIWLIWVSIGIICVALEIFFSSFIFISFGLGAIITGIFASAINNISVLLIIFSIFSFSFFFIIKKFGKYLFDNKSKTNIDALIEKIAFAQEDIIPDKKGLVKVGGELWSAISNQEIKENEKVVIKEISGNTLIVEKYSKNE